MISRVHLLVLWCVFGLVSGPLVRAADMPDLMKSLQAAIDEVPLAEPGTSVIQPDGTVKKQEVHALGESLRQYFFSLNSAVTDENWADATQKVEQLRAMYLPPKVSDRAADVANGIKAKVVEGNEAYSKAVAALGRETILACVKATKAVEINAIIAHALAAKLPPPPPQTNGSGNRQREYIIIAASNWQQMMARMESELYEADISDMISVKQLVMQWDGSPETLAAVAAIENKLNERRVNALAAFLNHKDQMLAKLNELFKTSEDPAAFDALIEDLNAHKYFSDSMGSNREARQAQDKISQALQFIDRWQEYLAKKRAGNPEAAARTLETFSNFSELPVNRSLLLQKQFAAAAQPSPANGASTSSAPVPASTNPDDFWLAAKTLEDLPELIKRLSALPANGRNVSDSINAAGNLQSAIENFQSGVYGPAWKFGVEYSNGSRYEYPHYTALRNQLAKLALPGYLGMKEVPASPPTETSTALAWRIAESAKDSQDWMLRWRALDAYKNLAFGQGEGPRWLADEIGGYAYFLQAENYFRADSYVPAYCAYRSALGGKATSLPFDLIKSRMSEMVAKKPETESKADLYEAGLALQRARLYPGYPGMRGNDSQAPTIQVNVPAPSPVAAPTGTPKTVEPTATPATVPKKADVK